MSSPNKSSIRIDSRKFLSTLNDSAQAKVALFEERVSQLGKAAGKNWRLAALHARQLYIEDVETHQYFVADHSKESHGKVAINNIKPLEIVESEKQGLFSETCVKLIDAIEENNQKGMQVAFDRMKAQRFSGRAVPCSGVVKCRDGVLRHVNVMPNSLSLEEDTRTKLISIIVESLRNNVIVENGSVVAGNFNDGDPIRLPVTKWAARKLIAKRMMEAAKNAYWSKGFQDRVYKAAQLVSESKIEEAVRWVSPFLNEMEEFTLLNYKQTKTLVENALAAKAIFNQQLADDTATLLFRTNMKISRAKILDEWRNIAKKSEHSVLAENVQKLQESKNFESSYQKFLSLIFEAISNREVAAEALATTLDTLRDKTPKIKESHDLSSKLNNLITRLKDKDVDDSAIYEAEDLIATIQEELAATDNLQNFDQVPPLGGEEDFDMEQSKDAESGAPIININSPLIQIGGKSVGGGEKEDLEPDLDLSAMETPPEEEGGDDELDALLGGGPEQAPTTPAAGAGAAGAPRATPTAPTTPPMEGRKSRKALSESRPVHYEMKDENDDDKAGDEAGDEDCDIEESHDPYALSAKEKNRIEEGLYITDYGAPVISDADDLQKIISVMRRLAVEHKLTGQLLEKNLPSMAQASIRALGLRIPTEKMDSALEQVINTFNESSQPFPGAAPPFGKKKSDKKPSGKPWENDEECDEDESCDEGMAEDQYHSPHIPSRGLGRASVKKTTSESISWGQRQEDAVLGECAGVKFIFDHGGNSELPPVILSEDASVEIPIPEELHESAFAAAKMAAGDERPFIKWMNESIEQLRPIADEEDQALNEAMAKITTGPDGSISVEVDGDVEISDNDEPEMDDDSSEEEVELNDSDKMAPVDSIEMPSPEETDDSVSDKMPDFESMEDEEEEGEEEGEEEDEEEGEENEEDEEDEGFAEDKDVTNPENAKYLKHVKEDPRKIPDTKMPQCTDDDLEDIGPTVKKDDGTGTKPPTAKKGD